MDDLFGSNEQQNDPTADFLRREQEALGSEASAFGNTHGSSSRPGSMAAATTNTGTAAQGRNSYDDFERGASAFPDLDEEGELVDSSAAAVAAGSSHAAAAQPVSVTGHDDLAAFEEEYPEIDVPSQQPAAPAQTNGFSSGAPRDAPAAAPASNNQFSLSVPQEDSEFIKEWRVKQKEEIDRREEAAAKKKEEDIVKAQHAVDNFYKEYNAKKEKNIATNKEEEAKFLQQMTDDLAKGTTWERICNLVDLQDSRSKTTSKSKQDLSRFKEILLSLKREGDNAPGAAGY